MVLLEIKFFPDCLFLSNCHPSVFWSQSFDAESSVNVIEDSLYVMGHFFSCFFQDSAFSFWQFDYGMPSAGFPWFYSTWILLNFCIGRLIFFIQFLISSKIVSASSAFSSSPKTPMMLLLLPFLGLQISLRFCLFFFILFFFLRLDHLN